MKRFALRHIHDSASFHPGGSGGYTIQVVRYERSHPHATATTMLRTLLKLKYSSKCVDLLACRASCEPIALVAD